MMKLNISIRGFSKPKFKNLFNKSWLVSKNRVFEVELLLDTVDLFQVSLDLSFTGKDHAGPELLVNLFGVCGILKLYDCRHWDYEQNTWENGNDK